MSFLLLAACRLNRSHPHSMLAGSTLSMHLTTCCMGTYLQICANQSCKAAITGAPAHKGVVRGV